jgi:hypothetical protein
MRLFRKKTQIELATERVVEDALSYLSRPMSLHRYNNEPVFSHWTAIGPDGFEVTLYGWAVWLHPVVLKARTGVALDLTRRQRKRLLAAMEQQLAWRHETELKRALLVRRVS